MTSPHGGANGPPARAISTTVWWMPREGDAVAVLCTTSGTTANPKLAMLSAGRLLRHCAAYLAFDPRGPDDEYVSVLPLPWIMEQVYALGMALLSRMTVNFVEEPDTMMHDFREIAPTFVLFAPRVWEAIAADVRARIMDSSTLKQALYGFGMTRGLAALAHGRRSAVADVVLFRALRDRLGFSRLRSAATGGAALGPDTFGFFRALGVPLRQLYGQTELIGAYTLHRDGEVDPDSVGVAFDDSIEMRIEAPDANGVGEVVTRHPNMFLGYYKNPEETAASLRDGWMQTGDAGYVNQAGQLVVIDRVRDLAVTARGTRFSPQYIENKLKFSPYIAEAVILGAGRAYLAAMICIRYSIVAKWAEKSRMSFTTYTDSRLPAGGVCTAAPGGRGGERRAAAGPADRQVPSPLQGARCRRRRIDPHPQGAAQRHRREIRRHHPGHLRGPIRHRRRHDHPVPGRHDPAHSHDACGGGPRDERAGAPHHGRRMIARTHLR